MSKHWPMLGSSLLCAMLLSPVLSGQDKKVPQDDKSAPKEEIFKGTISGLEQVGTHKLRLKKDVAYTFNMDSPGFFTKVRIDNGEGQMVHSFNGSSIFKAPENGQFILRVSSPGGSSGQYVLSVHATKLSPSKPGEILTVDKEGLIVEAILSKEDPRDKKRKAYSRIYNVKMDGGKFYVIELSSRQFDAFLRLENNEGKQLAQDDDSGGGTNARIKFKAPSDGAYRVIATSYRQETGLFVLKIREE